MQMDYVKEVERFLVEKRNGGLMIFHKEWLLIEKWESMGIPVNIVKEGIENNIILYDIEGYYRIKNA